MFLKNLVLAISCSMDSLALGITYGLKGTKLKKYDKIILFSVSILITLFSILIGNILKNIFNKYLFKFIGSLFLLFIGLIILFKNNKNEYTFDLDNSNDIDYKEALLLGFALSIDSFCIGIGAFALGINMFIFAAIVACLQFLFLILGNFFGVHLSNLKSIPRGLLNKISGIILIIIGIFSL